MKGAIERYTLRKERIKKKIRGTVERPRLSVYRSLNHIYAQIIDDTSGKVLAYDSTMAKDLKDKKLKGKISAAEAIGRRIAEKAVASGVKKVIFDRGGWPYHGRIKALAESARKAGLSF